MSLNECLLVAQLASIGDRQLMENRVAALAQLYEALGPVSVDSLFIEPLQAFVAVLRLGGHSAPLNELVGWGHPLPRQLAEADDLLSAPDTMLRRLPTPLTAVALAGDRGCIVTAPGGTTSLYAAQSDRVSAWSSHAVAAAWLGTGAATLNVSAIPEFLSWEFVGGERTLLKEARAVPQGTRIDLRPGAASERTYWSATERWAPIPADDAQAAAETALLESLAQSLTDASQPVLGLTAGADSRTAAVALHELGLSFSAFTFVGDLASAETEPASRVAQELGIEHQVAAIELWEPTDGLKRLEAEALWTDGAAPGGFGHVPWPTGISHWITGVGAEVGRSFYYRWARPKVEHPSDADLEQVIWAQLRLDIGGTRRETRRALRERTREWIQLARDTGHAGWSVLDVVYGEQRVRRWGRAMTPRMTAAHVPAFGAQALLQALASLPLEARLSDGFPRSFIGKRVPVLTPPRPADAAGRLPPLLRRRAVLALRSARQSLGISPIGKTDGPIWFEQPPWPERRPYIDWLVEDVIGSPVMEDAMGARWQSEVRRNFGRGEPHAAYLANWATGPVALEAQVRRLHSIATP